MAEKCCWDVCLNDVIMNVCLNVVIMNVYLLLLGIHEQFMKLCHYKCITDLNITFLLFSTG